jgi:hypothetical protein
MNTNEHKISPATRGQGFFIYIVNLELISKLP